jgi:hypothetical protein
MQLAFHHNRLESSILRSSDAARLIREARRQLLRQLGYSNVSTNGCHQSSAQAKGCHRRDGDEFVISFQPEDLIVSRHPEPRVLRKACLFFDGKL